MFISPSSCGTLHLIYDKQKEDET